MQSHTRLAALREVLAELYSAEADARVVVADAGLNERLITFSSRAQTNWQNILAEAIRCHRLEALLAALPADYQNHPALQAALADYRQLLAEGGSLTVDDDAPAPGTSPYQGMEYFDIADADRFFGREQLTAELVEHLRYSPLLAVVGASGSGKSSLVRAGLTPALQGTKPLIDDSQPPKGSSRWVYHIITPTAHPLKILAGSLTQESESTRVQAQLMDDLQAEPRSLDLYAHRLVKGDQRLLLVVDQLEELFTLCKDRSERQAFVENLLHAAQADGVVTLVMTLLSPLRRISRLAHGTGDAAKIYRRHEPRRPAPISLSPPSPEEYVKYVCRKSRRNFSQTEWTIYFGDETYRKTCENLA